MKLLFTIFYSLFVSTAFSMERTKEIFSHTELVSASRENKVPTFIYDLQQNFLDSLSVIVKLQTEKKDVKSVDLPKFAAGAYLAIHRFYSLVDIALEQGSLTANELGGTALQNANKTAYDACEFTPLADTTFMSTIETMDNDVFDEALEAFQAIFKFNMISQKTLVYFKKLQNAPIIPLAIQGKIVFWKSFYLILNQLSDHQLFQDFIQINIETSMNKLSIEGVQDSPFANLETYNIFVEKEILEIQNRSKNTPISARSLDFYKTATNLIKFLY